MAMQVIFRWLGQRPRLDGLESAPLSPGVEQGRQPSDKVNHFEARLAQEAPGPPEVGGPYQRLAEAIAAYHIFPPSLLTGVLRRNPIQAGDTFGACCHFLPGIDVFFAGRVRETFDGRDGSVWRAGFTFQTLRGHPLIGEETFWVEKDGATGVVRAGLRSWSRPGTLLARLGLPFLRWFQTRASRLALHHLAQVAARPAPLAPGLHTSDGHPEPSRRADA
jgi:hypothetical protein